MAPPSRVQLLIGRPGFVVARTPNIAPMLLMKANWNEPSASTPAPVTLTATGTGTLTLRTLPVLGMPLTNTVASAQPGGKSSTGAEVNELVDQLAPKAGVRYLVCALSRLRSCTSG